MVGMVLWAWDGHQDWRKNGVHCRYVVLKCASELQSVSSSFGQVHGKLHKWLFGEELDKKVVATGFAFRNGAWKFNSWTFNSEAKEAIPDEGQEV